MKNNKKQYVIIYKMSQLIGKYHLYFFLSIHKNIQCCLLVIKNSFQQIAYNIVNNHYPNEGISTHDIDCQLHDFSWQALKMIYGPKILAHI